MLISLRSRYFRPSSVLESLPWLAERSIIGKKISSHSSASKFSLQSESSAKTTGLFLAFWTIYWKNSDGFNPFVTEVASQKSYGEPLSPGNFEILRLSKFAMKNILDKEKAERAATALMNALPKGECIVFLFRCWYMMMIQIFLKPTDSESAALESTEVSEMVNIC